MEPRTTCNEGSEGGFGLIQGKAFLDKDGQQWNRLPSCTVQPPSLQVFKIQLDKALSNLN